MSPLKYHFAPTGKSSKHMSITASASTTKSPVPTMSLYQRAQNLFRNVPILYTLCYEVLLSQGVSTLISYMFTTYTKQSIPQDHERASHTGKVYGRINFISGILQFAILPYAFSRRPPRDHYTTHLPKQKEREHDELDNNTTATLHSTKHRIVMVDWNWLLLPSILGIAGIIMNMVTEPKSDIVASGTGTGIISLNRFDVVTISFCTMKILEYSLRVALVERVCIGFMTHNYMFLP